MIYLFVASSPPSFRSRIGEDGGSSVNLDAQESMVMKFCEHPWDGEFHQNFKMRLIDSAKLCFLSLL